MSNDPNLTPYEKGKPNPVDLIGDLSPLEALAYTHHVILATGEAWSAFVGAVSGDGDDVPAWLADVPRALSVLADGWLEMQMAVGVNWQASTEGGNAETESSATAADTTL